MKSKYIRFALLRRIFQPWQWKRRKKRNRFEQTSRTLQRKISMRSTKDQLVTKDVLMPVKQCVFLWNLPDVEEILLWYPWKGKKEYVPLRTVRIAVMACSQKQGSLRAQAQLKTRTETFELVEEKQKLLDRRVREKKKNEREVREQALPSAYHRQTYLLKIYLFN
ncbi:hypothetical protein TNCV_4527371 [Trichonephila clavipes]|nr:hypothetical protein TNCV_4527371 [Trichonephila clavipes]